MLCSGIPYLYSPDDYDHYRHDPKNGGYRGRDMEVHHSYRHYHHHDSHHWMSWSPYPTDQCDHSFDSNCYYLSHHQRSLSSHPHRYEHRDHHHSKDPKIIDVERDLLISRSVSSLSDTSPLPAFVAPCCTDGDVHIKDVCSPQHQQKQRRTSLYGTQGQQQLPQESSSSLSSASSSSAHVVATPTESTEEKSLPPDFVPPRPNIATSPSKNSPPRTIMVTPSSSSDVLKALSSSSTMVVSPTVVTSCRSTSATRLYPKKQAVKNVIAAASTLMEVEDEKEEVEVRCNDVLCGRGAPTCHHPGNEHFRDLVNKYQTVYLSSKRFQKPDIANHIVKKIHQSGGRFLKRRRRIINKSRRTFCCRNASVDHHFGDRRSSSSSWIWYEIDDRRAYEKASQALREGAPELRRQMSSPRSNQRHHHQQQPRTAATNKKLELSFGDSLW